MENFTPYSALIGGMLIGLSAVILYWFNGRIAGISGILNGAVLSGGNERVWRGLFLVGLILGGSGYYWLADQPFALREGFPVTLLLLAGFLVGFGTRLGSGCTSGHGICGIARFSTRSIVATITFVASGIVTVYIAQHVLGVGV